MSSSSWVSQSIASDLFSCEDERIPSANVVIASILSAEPVYRELLIKENPIDASESEACELVRRALHSLQTLDLELTLVKKIAQPQWSWSAKI